MADVCMRVCDRLIDLIDLIDFIERPMIFLSHFWTLVWARYERELLKRILFSLTLDKKGNEKK